MRTLRKYLKIWWLMSRNSFVMVISQRLSVAVFLIGKVLRFIFFFGFLFFLLLGSKTLGSYTSDQVIFFYLTFTLVDIIAQFFFREVYRFRQMIVRGDFDYVMVKPMSALFRSLLGGADVIDFITIPPIIFAVIYYGTRLNPTFSEVFLYVLLVINGLIIAAAFHIIVLAMAIITLEIDHSIMIYRDLVSLGRLPVDIYKEPLKGFLTYFIPVGIMVTFPVKSILGLSSVWGVLVAFLVGILSMFVALRFWNFALKKYSSASS